MKGKVVYYKPSKGYGFIQSSDYSDDISLNIADVIGETPSKMDWILFEVIEGKKGLKAMDVRRLVE